VALANEPFFLLFSIIIDWLVSLLHSNSDSRCVKTSGIIIIIDLSLLLVGYFVGIADTSLCDLESLMKTGSIEKGFQYLLSCSHYYII